MLKSSLPLEEPSQEPEIHDGILQTSQDLQDKFKDIE
jgi:hypothetical protein